MDGWIWALIGAGGVLVVAAIAAAAWWWLLRRRPGGHSSAEAPAFSADLQDPLPESNWLWRRLLFLGAAVLHAIAYGWVLWKVGELGASAPAEAIAALVQLGLFLTIMIVVDRLLYTIAPSAEQITKWFNVVTLLRNGVGLFSRATATTAEGTAESTVSAGQAAPPAAQPPRVSVPPPPDDPTSYGGIRG